MSYLPTKILLRQHDRPGLKNIRQALTLAESAVKDGRYHDAERLIEIVYDRIASRAMTDPTRH